MAPDAADGAARAAAVPARAAAFSETDLGMAAENARPRGGPSRCFRRLSRGCAATPPDILALRERGRRGCSWLKKRLPFLERAILPHQRADRRKGTVAAGTHGPTAGWREKARFLLNSHQPSPLKNEEFGVTSRHLTIVSGTWRRSARAPYLPSAAFPVGLSPCPPPCSPVPRRTPPKSASLRAVLDQLQAMLAVTLSSRRYRDAHFREPSGDSVLPDSGCAMDAPPPPLNHKQKICQLSRPDPRLLND